MPKPFILLFLIFPALPSSAQSFKEEFSRLLSKKDTAAQKELLQKWQLNKPGDAELFIAFFNYYFVKSRSEIVNLTASASSDSSLRITDSLGNTVGFLYDELNYDPGVLAEGFHYIDSGISQYPARLDMRFGKIYVLGEIKEYEKFTGEIIQTIHFAKKINHKWTWKNNQELDEPENFLLGTIQEYIVQLYNAGDEQLNRMRSIALAVLQYYPDHVESLSNLAITYSLQGDQDKALEALLRAEKVAPRDFIVLNNIANIYTQKGDKPNAIKYYELALQYGDADAKALATEKLKELKK
jgi:tetratricopeptide (TPR) repeat protein